MPTTNGLTLGRLAGNLTTLVTRNAAMDRTVALLRGGAPDECTAVLDAHLRTLRRYLIDIEAALIGLSHRAATELRSAQHGVETSPFCIDTGDDRIVDTVAHHIRQRLIDHPMQGNRLAVAIGRLIEESSVLQPEARRIRPLGRGFEPLLHDRLQRRFDLLPDRARYLDSLYRHRMLLLEEPAEAMVAIANDLGVILDEDAKLWLDVERRVATLRFVRRDKTEEGQIRWFVRADEQHDVVLDRLGVRGHWIACGHADSAMLTRVATAVERVVIPARTPVARSREGWRMVICAPRPGHATTAPSDPPVSVHPDTPIPSWASLLGSEPISWHRVPTFLDTADSSGSNITGLRSRVRRSLDTACSSQDIDAAAAGLLDAFGARRAGKQPNDANRPGPCTLTVEDGRLCLTASYGEFLGKSTADVAVRPTQPDELLSFLDTVDRVADIAPPIDRIDTRYDSCESVVWVRALLRDHSAAPGGRHPAVAGLRVRLVYVPSSIPHQLGGVPLIGLEFLRDRLEYEGAGVHILQIPKRDFERRIAELLGADVIGIGVYIHNRNDVADLVTLLRTRGYRGKIILGGPELRNIDTVQSDIDGWDAIIRGEAEDALPAVIEILWLWDAERWSEGIERARSLHGVALRCGTAVLLCDTASRNRAGRIVCPLPFDWARGKTRRRLQMNFTRGCPYLCTFCPNHQGRRFRPGSPDELWRYTLFAVADDVALSPPIATETAATMQVGLGVGDVVPNLPLALHLFARSPVDHAGLATMLAPLLSEIDPDLVDDPDALEELVGSRQTIAGALAAMAQPAGTPVSAWLKKEAWLIAKVAVLATRLRRANASRTTAHTAPQAKNAFVLETSEDNTLVNRATMVKYLKRRTKYGLDDYFVFNPGQNTIWDLTDRKGGPDEDYIDILVDRNPFAVALGADGTSNPVIRQNHKPFYGVRELLAVNRALVRRGVTVVDNYILLTPETDLLEAVEAFLLFLVLPVPWRDYGEAVNLRVIKEESTLATDEGLLFAPGDQGFDVPLRFPEVGSLLHRWSLSSSVPARELKPLLWRILAEDPPVSALLPHVIDRWEADFDDDPELVAIARLVRALSSPDVSLLDTLKIVRERLAATFGSS